MIDYEKTKAWRSDPVRHSYATKDTILYALGLGLGTDPLDAQQLRYVYEKDLVALPTMAAVLASPGSWMRDRKELGIDFLKLVHGEQGVTIHSPLSVAGTVVGESRVVRLVDKGEGKGAILHVEKSLKDEASGQLLATAEQVLFLRGDGGFSAGQGGDEPAPALPAPPETAADVALELPTRPEAALLYRLSGDLNPLHADPVVAAKAGFPKPILHGLASWGNAGRGIVQLFCGHDPARLRSIRARLTSPVYPGETLVLECWRVAADEVAFRARVKERDVVVLNNGRAGIAA
ncbi:MAG: 3-alpha,7-alpha,12-alpha-trihydroxy-5-beta-cholest-24-enoyl-CoA hydratase [Comamonadaceae bacterium]|uniref:MaoC/PaaZ C-terminal domain-containing protein n=1 Tax=Hydrogenophaga sp. TaxID=1904254 RepID=UPI000EF0B931|nr:MaoC/PaaZ C-terminal domain-containing protein [Hydrogenophaga sp.]MDO9504307.1 MaoC/PaaZ C-terminal domain-containing protein [Hydrogenophaga sp.]RJP66292.1 MAG: 3-alpha,7-alpha,12-alpha-trihydroxy-5-beta-cholest-24-enoyl-CoA hydratase [Comamonadaceae bacterium]